MSGGLVSYTLLIEEHAKLSSQKADNTSDCKIPLWEMKILLADLCYLFSRDDEGYDLQKLYACNYRTPRACPWMNAVAKFIAQLWNIVEL